MKISAWLNINSLPTGLLRTSIKRHKLPSAGRWQWTICLGSIGRLEDTKVPPDPEFRHSLEEKVAKVGKDELYQELAKVDPVAAQRIDPRNVRRIIRALEVYRETKVPFSQLQLKANTTV